MPRRRRLSTAGFVFHVMNRSAKRARLFQSDQDYEAFERILSTALERGEVALFAYCIMPNHWHFLLSPFDDGGLSRFMHWLTTTHARRWQLYRKTEGQGAVYQGRFKAVPVSSDDHFLRVCRYVERNALRAALVERAEDWRWSSLARIEECDRPRVTTAEWPVSRPADWTRIVNEVQTEAELDAIRTAVRMNQPIGNDEWKEATAAALGLRSFRRGRPRKVNGVGAQVLSH
jgi:putative transposase